MMARETCLSGRARPEVLEAIADLVVALQEQGATFTVSPAGHLPVDLNPVAGLTLATAGVLARIVLGLRTEIKQVLATPPLTIH